MTERTPPSPPRPPKARRKPSKVARGATQAFGAVVSLGVLGLVVLVVVAGVYGFRREVARQVLTGWLDRHGIDSEVHFERIDLNGLTATLRAGPADDPDLAVDRIEIDYDLSAPGGGLSVTPTRIRAIRPQVKATWRDGTLSFGSLDPIIEEFTRRPPSPDRGGPVILIEGARARVFAPGGILTANAYARLERGRLMRLDAGIPAARLTDGDRRLDLRGALVTVRSDGERLTLALAARIGEAAGPVVQLGAGRVAVTLDSPYPDQALRRADGPVRAQVAARLDRAAWQGGSADAVDLDLGFDGRANGWIDRFGVLGALRGQVRAGRLEAGEARLTQAAAALDGRQFRVSRREDINWRYEGDALVSAGSAAQGDLGGRQVTLRFTDLLAGGGEPGVEARGQLTLAANELNQGELALTGVDGRFDMDTSFTGASLVTLNGSVRSRGGRWPVLGAVTAQDIPEQATLKRAFQDFALSAPGIAIRAGSPGTMVRLTQAAVIAPRGGGRVTIAALPGAALYAQAPGAVGAGGLNLTTAGGGLPEATVRVSRYAFDRGTIAARLDGRAGLNFGLARDVDLTTQGRLTIAGGRTTFEADGCSPVTVGLLELGENDVDSVAASLCPAGEPLVVIADGWRFRANVQGLSANAPFLGMALSNGTGAVSAGDAGRGLGLEARIADGLVTDTEDPLRFHPMRAAGSVQLADEDWTGAFQVLERASGTRIADLGIRHDGQSQSGGLTIDARGLTFAEGGLQPSMLTPMTDAFLTSPVTGVVDFTGGMDWTPAGVTSQGVASTQGLDFVSPLGAVGQLAGTIQLTSLTPLVSAPDQTVSIGSIAAVAPLSAANVTFQLTPDAIRLGRTEVGVAGGRAWIESLAIPLDPTQSYEGVLILDRVQLGDVLGAVGMAENVQLDAVVSGRLPFVAGPNGITIIEGQIHAVQPGRLAIAREALDGVSAEGGGEEVPVNAVQDFAYQALEHLYFDRLEATLNSLPQGRMGVLFTIHGRHDPPVQQELRLTFMDIIRQRFLNQQLPLPSGTEVNLTLDTSFNLDQLIGDLMEIERARRGEDRSDAVQPDAR